MEHMQDFQRLTAWANLGEFSQEKMHIPDTRATQQIASPCNLVVLVKTGL